MRLLTTSGARSVVFAIVQEFDGLDPSPADALTWFEEAPNRYRLEVYVRSSQDESSALAVIGHAAPDQHVYAKDVDDADWVAMALEGLPAVQAGRFVIAGRHALNRTRGGRKGVWIEASEAFGTGHHATTRGCLLALEGVLRRRRVRNVLDIGAGSAVLAIAAAKTGARALAVEIDPRAARIARTNVHNNRVKRRVRIVTGDGACVAPTTSCDLVFANILMRPLIRLAPRLARLTAPGGSLVLSGLLQRQEPLVRLAYQTRGFVLAGRIRRENWATLIWRRSGRPLRRAA